MIDLPCRIVMPEPITPIMFAQLRLSVGASKHTKHYTETSATSGHVSTTDADFDYAYDGSGSMALTVTALNSWLARHASLEQVTSHVNADLQEMFGTKSA